MNNPQRCFSCNKIIGNLWESYEELMKKKSLAQASPINKYTFSHLLFWY